MDEFGLAIRQHLELQARNRMLEEEMPLDRYRTEGAASRAPVRSERDVALEDTQEWSFADEVRAPGKREPLFEPVEELWSGTPAFDWGE